MLRAAFETVAFLAILAALLFGAAGGTPADLALGGALAALLYPGTLAAAGLDARFAGSPPLPQIVQELALLVFALGYGFALLAMRANPFFATVVRVQRERGHHVIETGPYAIVRHPGYAGAIAAHLALPIALGSLWAAIPATLGCLLVVARVGSEERTLERELDGYAAYRSRVRWHLVPGLW